MLDTAAPPITPPRRGTLRALGLWLALVATLVCTGSTAAGADGTQARPASLTGTWETEVTVGTGPDASVATSRFHFAADHTLTTDGAPDENGEPQYPGTGYWTTKGNGTFSFYITHPGPEEAGDGVYPGTVHSVHLGRISGGTFVTTAVAFAKNERDGTLQGPVTVSSKATRVSASGR